MASAELFRYRRFSRNPPRGKINIALYSPFVMESLILTAAKQLLMKIRIMMKKYFRENCYIVNFMGMV